MAPVNVISAVVPYCEQWYWLVLAMYLKELVSRSVYDICRIRIINAALIGRDSHHRSIFSVQLYINPLIVATVDRP